MSDWGETLRRRAVQAAEAVAAAPAQTPARPVPPAVPRDSGPPVDWSRLPRELAGPVALVDWFGRRTAVDVGEWDAWWAWARAWNETARARAAAKQARKGG